MEESVNIDQVIADEAYSVYNEAGIGGATKRIAFMTGATWMVEYLKSGKSCEQMEKDIVDAYFEDKDCV